MAAMEPQRSAAPPRGPARALLLALALSLALHVAAAGAMALIVLQPVQPVEADTPPIPIQLRFAPAAGGGESQGDELADAASGPDAPAPESALPEDDVEPETRAEPEPVALASVQESAPTVLGDEVEVAPADVPLEVAGAGAAPRAASEPPPAAFVARAGEWQGPPPSGGLVAADAGNAGVPAQSFLGRADAGASAEGGSGGGSGGGAGEGVGAGPGGSAEGVGLVPVPSGSNLAPEYPMLARRRGEEGLVVVRLQVLADGTVDSAAIQETSGHALLDDAALEAVAQWTFEPARRAGQPVAALLDVPIRFRLRPR